MAQAVVGLAWIVEYDGINDANKTFLKFSMVQTIQNRTFATHTFFGAESGGGPTIDSIISAMDGKDIKFRIHNSKSNESEQFEHHVVFVQKTTSFSSKQINFLTVYSIDKASWKLMNGSKLRGVKGDKLEDIVRSVFDGAGVEIDVKAKTDPVPEFKSLYQPGVTDYDFCFRHVMPRFPNTIVLTPVGTKYLLEDVGKFEDWKVDQQLITKVSDISNSGEAYRELGGPAKIVWMDPLTGREKSFSVESPPDIPGAGGELQFHRQGLTTKEGVASILSGTSGRRGWFRPKQVIMEGVISNNGKPIAPIYRFNCEGLKLTGMVTSINHLIENSKYTMTVGLWSK